MENAPATTIDAKGQLIPNEVDPVSGKQAGPWYAVYDGVNVRVYDDEEEVKKVGMIYRRFDSQGDAHAYVMTGIYPGGRDKRPLSERMSWWSKCWRKNITTIGSGPYLVAELVPFNLYDHTKKTSPGFRYNILGQGHGICQELPFLRDADEVAKGVLTYACAVNKVLSLAFGDDNKGGLVEPDKTGLVIWVPHMDMIDVLKCARAVSSRIVAMTIARMNALPVQVCQDEDVNLSVAIAFADEQK